MTMSNNDQVRWHAHLTIEKFDEAATARAEAELGHAPTGDDFARLGIKPYEVGEVDENLLTTAGLTRIASLIIAAGGTAPTNTTARLGLGNGSGTAAVGDTDLSAAAGSANRWFQVMDATFPSASGAVITFKSTFASADGNFAWNEWGVDIGTATVTSGNTVNATLLNHKTSIAQGTKASGQSWAATATITFS
jgi:hypothetical protein